MNETGQKRKTLIERAQETKVRDPSAHARHQVVELDKTAQRSQAQRKKCTEQIESDMKEIAHIEHQIAMLKERYDPLCEHLKDAKEQKEGLVNTLEKCVTESKRIMGDTKSTIQTRRIEDTKLNRKMSSLELEVLRGYNMRSETTFHQTKSSPSEEEQKSKESAKLFRARLNADRIRSSMDKSFSAKSLPPLKDSKSGTMPRNKSSML